MNDSGTWTIALTAVPLGIAFGVILERTGLGNPRIIAAQLRGKDFTVVRVMFGAIVTTMLGLAWASRAGWIDGTGLAIPPTDVAGQVLGGVIFGGGFALAALCPGTACVAASAGRRDGMATVAGILVGTALTAFLWPVIGAGVSDMPHEAATLDADLGVSREVVIVGITLVALVMFAIARRFSSVSDWWRPRSLEIVGVTLAFAYAMTGASTVPVDRLSMIAREIEREADHVDAIDLAQWIHDGRADLMLLDVRDGVDSTTYMIPGAAGVSLSSLPTMELVAGKTIVLYSDGGAHAAQGWVLLRARGVREVLVLKDGMASWEDEVLQPAVPPPNAPDSTRIRFHKARTLSLWFGGRPRLDAPSGAGAQPATAPRPRRRNTC